ncbi:hypothetical protein K469DRAFT_553046 [Zopfia rhizophila CBS 207.26]|uniref:MARVEL domain-containing protein n=1 Tax=Zopfia rhizophila CBS 207.26 TaxID=1314779 RepID=A0A6A6ENY3_9PEZI|nr:hypothetical protein K469DRAFT_553046 [Zopfia rhizophila CBS 207.26]
MPVAGLALRGAQVLSTVVVLGVSVSLIKDQDSERTVPAALSYAAFVGGVGLLGAIIGITSNWVDMLQGIIMGGIDVLMAIFNLAGGVVLAYKLRGITCSSGEELNLREMRKNELLNGGCVVFRGNQVCAYGGDPGKMQSRCKQNEADAAFMFIGFIVLAACLVITFLQTRRK